MSQHSKIRDLYVVLHDIYFLNFHLLQQLVPLSLKTSNCAKMNARNEKRTSILVKMHYSVQIYQPGRNLFTGNTSRDQAWCQEKFLWLKKCAINGKQPYYAFHWYVHSEFFLASERRSTVDVRRRPGYKIWRLFKFEFSEVNINSQCLVLNDRSTDENLKRRQIL
jgi:hypothetical protein